MNSELLQLLKQVAYDRYLALWLAPPGTRKFLLALFSLEQELLHLPDKVSNPTLGVLRVTWWRDAISALATKPASGNPVLQALAEYSGKAALLADYAETFDAAFYEEDPTSRLTERAGFMAALLADEFSAPLPLLRQYILPIYGVAADCIPGQVNVKTLAFLADVAQKRLSRLRLTLKAVKLSLIG